MPGISLEELTWTGRSCIAGSRPRTHEASQGDGLTGRCKRMDWYKDAREFDMSWENMKLGDWGAKEENSSLWGDKTGGWGEKGKQRAGRQLPFPSAKSDSDRIAPPCLLNDKESKEDPCKQQAGKQIFVNVWSMVRFEAKSITGWEDAGWKQQWQSASQAKSLNFERSHLFSEALQQLEWQLYDFWSKQHWLNITVTVRLDFFSHRKAIRIRKMALSFNCPPLQSFCLRAPPALTAWFHIELNSMVALYLETWHLCS